MRRTSLWILALALAAGACGSDDDRPVDPARLSLQIVSGDRQPATVADAPTVSGAALVPGLSLQQLPDNLLPQPLVARIVVDGEPLASRSPDPLGPSLATLPSDVVVTYRVIQPTGVGQRHCGDSFLSSAKPDANGEVTTYWERGTYAGECRMEVRLVVDGQPRVDTAFVVEFEPGGIWRLQLGRDDEQPVPYAIEQGDTFDGRRLIVYAWDQHGNKLDRALIDSHNGAGVRWAWYDRTKGGVHAPATHEGEGWIIVAPDFSDYAISYDGMRAPGLSVWIEQSGRSDGVTFSSP